uniref:Uncharacterized protein n=1 Tax=Romanomermis culicivorax TaxID=13658 RepID=A0A915L995_ROMCU
MIFNENYAVKDASENLYDYHSRRMTGLSMEKEGLDISKPTYVLEATSHEMNMQIRPRTSRKANNEHQLSMTSFQLTNKEKRIKSDNGKNYVDIAQAGANGCVQWYNQGSQRPYQQAV